MSEDEIRERIGRMPELATGLIVPSCRFDAIANAGRSQSATRAVVLFNGIRVVETSLIPPHQALWIDAAGSMHFA